MASKDNEKGVQFGAWPKLLLIGVGYVIAGALGAEFISPTGPGSSGPVYICLMAYSLLVAVFCSRLIRLLGLLLAIVFLTAKILDDKAGQDFRRHLLEHRWARQIERESQVNGDGNQKTGTGRSGHQ
jgi:hypothetical protein